MNNCTPQGEPALQMNEEVQQLLIRSCGCSDNLQIKEITSALHELEMQRGYIPALVAITMDMHVDLQTTCAALAQLKNCIRKYWQAQSQEYYCFVLHEDDRIFLMNNIFSVAIELVDNRKESKLVKDVISLIGVDLMPISETIKSSLESNFEVKSCLNVLLGLIDCEIFSSSLSRLRQNGESESQTTRTLFVERMIPNLTQLVKQDNIDEESKYLAIKFMKKAVPYVRSDSIREHCYSWAIYCMMILQQKQKYKNFSNIDEVYSQLSRKSEEFIYFHLRKWAVKYLISFLMKMPYYHTGERNTQTIKFVEQHWGHVLQVVHNLFEHESPRKISKFNLKLIETCFKVQPRRMAPEFNYYMFNILPRFIYISKEDEELVRSSPSELISLELGSRFQVEHLRLEAEGIWLSILFQCQIYSQNFKEYYGLCLEFINRTMKQQRDLYVAARLLINIWEQQKKHIFDNQVLASEEYRSELRAISQELISILLSINHPMYIYLGLNIFVASAAYIDLGIKRSIAECINIYLLDPSFQLDGHELVKIQSVIALGFLDGELIQNFKTQSLQLFLSYYVQFMQLYDLDQIVLSFKQFVNSSIETIEPFAVGLIGKIGEFIKQKLSIEEDAQITEEWHHSASRRGVIEQLIELFQVFSSLICPETFQIKESLETELEWLLNFILTANINDEYVLLKEYKMEVYNFFAAFLQAHREYKIAPSKRVEFFLNTILLKFVGISRKQLKLLEDSQFQTEIHKDILCSCYKTEKYYYLEKVKIFISYIFFLDPREEIRPLQNITSLLTNSTFMEKIVAWYYYSYEYKENQLSLEKYLEKVKYARASQTIIFSYLIEEHQYQLQPNMLCMMWNAALSNSEQAKHLKDKDAFNMQLVLLLTWVEDRRQEVLRNDYLVLISELITDLDQFYEKGVNLSHDVEVNRTILGLSSCLKIALKYQHLCEQIPKIMKLLIHYVGFNMHLSEFFDDEKRGDEYGYGSDEENTVNLTEEEECYERMRVGKRERDFEMENLCDKRKLYYSSQTRLQDETNVDAAFVEALLVILKKEPSMYWMILQLFQCKITKILEKMPDLREELRVVLLGEHAEHHQGS